MGVLVNGAWKTSETTRKAPAAASSVARIALCN
jgi:hypothetical protein